MFCFWCWGWFCNIDCNLSMNMGDRRLWIQNIGRKHWGYKHRLCLYHQFYFPSFLVVYYGGGWVGGKFATFKIIWRIGVSGASILGGIIEAIRDGNVRDRGDVDCNFIINFMFLLVLNFHCVSWLGRKFAISQWIWGIGVSRDRILGGIIKGISVGCVKVRGGVDCVLISHGIYVPFRKYLYVQFYPWW